MRMIALTSALLLSLSGAATAQETSPLIGHWRIETNSLTVRIAPCAKASGLCATVTDERPQPGEPSMLNQVVVRDIIPGKGRDWTGNYVVDGQTPLRARIRLQSANRATFRVCAMGVFCSTDVLNRL